MQAAKNRLTTETVSSRSFQHANMSPSAVMLVNPCLPLMAQPLPATDGTATDGTARDGHVSLGNIRRFLMYSPAKGGAAQAQVSQP